MPNPRHARMIAALAFSALLLMAPWAASASTSVIRLGNGAEPSSLDIHRATGISEANILHDLFEGLVTLGADGSLIPGAAKSWEISADGTVYTFHLRPDGRWSNGDPVTAGDFVYAFRRGLSPETAAEYAYILYPILNAEKVVKGEVSPDQLGVHAIDDLTLQIKLNAPTPYFLTILTHQMAMPLDPPTVKAAGDAWTRPGKMVSNGAYKLDAWVPNDYIKLVKNPYFHDAGHVSIDEVDYYPTVDVSQELQRYRAGELDATYSVPSDQIGWVKANLPGQYHNTPYLGTYYYAFNMTTAPFADDRVLRRALSLAIDRDVLTKKITKAGQVPAYSFVPPGVMNYQPQPDKSATWTQAERNARAKQLYAHAGYGPDNPLKVEILYNTSEGHKKIAIAIAAMWKEVLGVQTTLRNEEWKAYLASRNTKDFQIVRAGWIGDYNDADTFLDLLSSQAGKMNSSGYSNPRYDKLIQEAAMETDSAKREAMLEQAERIMLADAPIIPIYFYVTQHMVKPYVKGWVDNITDFHPTRFLSIAPH